jgi:AbrB family looped-hinge helix DNA binding protein
MQVTIDKAGRIVVPKPTRDRLGLRAESKLELVENDEGFQLTPIEATARLVRRPNGRLMLAGPGTPGTDWKNLVRNMREERMRKIAGR